MLHERFHHGFQLGGVIEHSLEFGFDGHDFFFQCLLVVLKFLNRSLTEKKGHQLTNEKLKIRYVQTKAIKNAFIKTLDYLQTNLLKLNDL